MVQLALEIIESTNNTDIQIDTTECSEFQHRKDCDQVSCEMGRQHNYDSSVERKFKCDHPGCNKSFVSSSLLLRHMRTHTGEKPYVCPICNKGFSQLGNMTKHLRSHENAHLRWDRHTVSKPFKCSHPGCNKSFTAKTSLQHHILTFHANIQQNRPAVGEVGIIDNIKTSESSNKSKSIIENATLCLHEGCSQIFTSEQELRQHLYEQTPGIVAEYSYLLKTVLHFADLIATWDQKTPDVKNDLRSYVLTVKQTIQQSFKDPLQQSAETIPSRLDAKNVQHGGKKPTGSEKPQATPQSLRTEQIPYENLTSTSSDSMPSQVTSASASHSTIPTEMREFDWLGQEDEIILDGLLQEFSNTPTPTPIVSKATISQDFDQLVNKLNVVSNDVNAVSDGVENSAIYTELLTAHSMIHAGWNMHRLLPSHATSPLTLPNYPQQTTPSNISTVPTIKAIAPQNIHYPASMQQEVQKVKPFEFLQNKHSYCCPPPSHPNGLSTTQNTVSRESILHDNIDSPDSKRRRQV